jgi:hypothetical protein
LDVKHASDVAAVVEHELEIGAHESTGAGTNVQWSASRHVRAVGLETEAQDCGAGTHA